MSIDVKLGWYHGAKQGVACTAAMLIPQRTPAHFDSKAKVIMHRQSLLALNAIFCFTFDM